MEDKILLLKIYDSIEKISKDMTTVSTRYEYIERSIHQHEKRVIQVEKRLKEVEEYIEDKEKSIERKRRTINMVRIAVITIFAVSSSLITIAYKLPSPVQQIAINQLEHNI